jgi:hypothetical protein
MGPLFLIILVHDRGNMRHILALASLIVLGCVATAEVMRLDTTPRQPRSPQEIQVLLEEPKEPFLAIALIEASDQGWGLSLDKIKERLLVEAGKVGGHAVIIGRESKGAGTAFVPIGQMWYAADIEEKKLVGKVIVFTGKK